MMYNYLVVGSGLYGAIFAHEAKKSGKTVLVVDKRPNIAGNVYTEKTEGINVHKYGAHIFHTNNKKVWNYITQFAEFNRFTNSPVANYKGELYSLPFNMYTFNKMWGVVTPEEAAAKIEEQRKEAGITEPKNLEEQAISLVGRDIYEKLIKGYTEKQWGRDCKDVFHCEPIEKVASEFVEECQISEGEFDNVGECRYRVPDYWTIGEVYERVIEDCYQDQEIMKGVWEVYHSWIDESISDYNTDFYYQSRDYIAECYKAGEILE